MPTAEPLSPDRAEDAVSVLCDAFHDYPVMRFVLGSEAPDYDARLRRLIGFFVGNRALRGEPMLVVNDGDTAVAAAVMTPPGERAAPPELDALREAVWRDLGTETRERYEYLGTVWKDFTVKTPHLHLNMIGVRRSHAGRGLARVLLDRVHAMSEADPGSAGVSLTTENPKNVSLYRYFGYRLVGHRQAGDLETWGFYRPDGAEPETPDSGTDPA